jgi:Zn-dependent peptidase ImmA (M78 family)
MPDVPISTRALRWIFEESGYSEAELSTELKADRALVRDWLAGTKRPNETEFQRLRNVLRRPSAIFFMSSPPAASPNSIEMRSPIKGESRRKNAKERVAIRDAARMQEMISWIREELGFNPEPLPNHQNAKSPEAAGAAVREWLGISVERQLGWSSPSQAFAEWRAAFQSRGILVFSYSLGEKSARGFSISSKWAPLVATNSFWSKAVRIFSIFHELGHLVTHTESTCVEPEHKHRKHSMAGPVERWCEQFAAAALIPSREAKEMVSMMHVGADSNSRATRLANRFHVSRSAALLWLIDHDYAAWDDFERLTRVHEFKPKGGGGGEGRNRIVVRADSYGEETLDWFRRALARDLIQESQVRSYLRVTREELVGTTDAGD